MAESPRDAFDNLSHFCLTARHYNLPNDDNVEWDDFGGWREAASATIPKGSVARWVWMYEHSGVVIRTSPLEFGDDHKLSNPFHDPWDSGIIGFAYITPEEIAENWPTTTSHSEAWSPQEMALTAIDADVETYSQYLNGEVYGMIVEERTHCDHDCDHWDEAEDSCFGFYGFDSVMEEAKSYLAHLTPRPQPQPQPQTAVASTSAVSTETQES
ncbi:MAG: hypothetical protein KGL39_37765 [Patescibacteria group bacterium]|nr:hypothetical protein [Patescibacteria group bacterium]